MEAGLQLKHEVDLDISIENPTEALELEYQNPDFDDTSVDADSYQQQVGLSSSSSFDSSVHEHIGKATAFMLSLAKRANQSKELLCFNYKDLQLTHKINLIPSNKILR